MKDRSIVPLAFLPVGRDAVIVDMVGGRGLYRKLTDLGFTKGAPLRVIQNDRGPLIVALGDSRVAIGFGMAQKVMVEEVAPRS